MGDPSLDDAVANLERFNQALTSLTPRLEESASELAGHVGELQSATDDIRTKGGEALAALGDLESEAATFADAAEQESEGVGGAAFDDASAALDTLDASVREMVEAVPHELGARASGLAQELPALEEQGFSPLHEALAQAGAALDGWSGACVEALHDLDGLVQDASQQLAQDRAFFDETDAYIVLHSDDTGWSPVQQAIYGVEEETPASFAHSGFDEAIGHTHANLQQQAAAATHSLREHIAALVHEVGEEISQRTLGLVNAVDGVVEACELVEHGAGMALDDATGAVTRAAALADLHPRIETAEAELEQIRTVMEAMDAP